MNGSILKKYWNKTPQKMNFICKNTIREIPMKKEFYPKKNIIYSSNSWDRVLLIELIIFNINYSSSKIIIVVIII